jgi:hypothetical protein
VIFFTIKFKDLEVHLFGYASETTFQLHPNFRH